MRCSAFIERSYKVIAWVALAAGLMGAAAFVIGVWGRLTFRYPFEYGETVMVLPMLRMAEVPWVYGDVAVMPHQLMPYHPLYVYVSYLISLLLNPGHFPVYTAGRIVTALAACMCAVWIFLICRRRAAAGRTVSLVAAALFVASPYLTGEAIHVKPDLTALALALGGLYFAISDNPGRRKTLSAALLFALAFLTKQNFLFAPAAAVLWLAVRGEWKNGLWLGAAAAIFALTGVGIIAWGSGGNYWDHAFLNGNPFYGWRIFWINWNKIGPQIGLILGCGLTAACVLALKPSKSSGALGIYWFICSLALVLMSKSGSGENHAIEPLAASCLTAGAVIGSVRGRDGEALSGYGVFLRMVIMTALAVNLCLFLPARAWNPAKIRAGLAVTEQKMDELIPLLKSIKGPILAENPGILIAAGLPVWYQAYEFAQMSYSGQFDQTVILNELREHKYKLIASQTNFFVVRGTGRFTPEFIQTLGQHYRFAGTKHGQYFYVPKEQRLTG